MIMVGRIMDRGTRWKGTYMSGNGQARKQKEKKESWDMKVK